MSRAGRAKPRKVRLAYRVVSPPDFPEVLVSGLRLAERIHRLHVALQTCKTWGELRSSVSERDYKSIVDDYYWNDSESRHVPAPDEPFDAELVGGYGDGDYPPWAKQLVERYLPSELLQKHAKREWNMVNGSWWTIPVEQWADLKRELEQRGFKLAERSDLTEFR